MKNESMEISTLFSYISSVATLATAIVIYLTLKEMIKQRKASFAPELVPIEQNIFAEKDSVIQARFATNWSKENTQTLPNTIKITNSEYTISFYNIGVGAAKNIKLKWVFPVKDFCWIINTIEKESKDSELVQKTSQNWLSFEKESGTQMCINLDLDLEENIDYILPASSELRPHEIKFPASYRFLLSLYLDLLHKSHVKKLNTAIEKIKPLQLHISYQDIADNVIEKKYKFEVNIVTISPSNGDNVTLFSGQLVYSLIKEN